MLHYCEFAQDELEVIAYAIDDYNNDLALIEKVQSEDCYLTDAEMDELLSALAYYYDELVESTLKMARQISIIRNLRDELNEL